MSTWFEMTYDSLPILQPVNVNRDGLAGQPYEESCRSGNSSHRTAPVGANCGFRPPGRSTSTAQLEPKHGSKPQVLPTPNILIVLGCCSEHLPTASYLLLTDYACLWWSQREQDHLTISDSPGVWEL